MARRRIPFEEDSFKTMVRIWNEEMGMTMDLGPYDVALHEVQEFITRVNYGKVKGFNEARLIVI